MSVDEMLRFQMSLVRLLTPREPANDRPGPAAAHPVEEQLEALVRKTIRKRPA
jgi:hypothetical protein